MNQAGWTHTPVWSGTPLPPGDMLTIDLEEAITRPPARRAAPSSSARCRRLQAYEEIAEHARRNIGNHKARLPSRSPPICDRP